MTTTNCTVSRDVEKTGSVRKVRGTGAPVAGHDGAPRTHTHTGMVLRCVKCLHCTVVEECTWSNAAAVEPVN